MEIATTRTSTAGISEGLTDPLLTESTGTLGAVITTGGRLSVPANNSSTIYDAVA